MKEKKELEVVGINQKAIDFLKNVYEYKSYEDGAVPVLGCPSSNGIIDTNSSLYEIDELGSTRVFLFEHYLSDGTVAQEIIQNVTENYIYCCLKIEGRRHFQWKEIEMK